MNRKDFVKLHKASNDHMGIVACTNDLDFQRLARNIDQKVKGLAHLQAQLLKVDRGNA